MGKDEKTFGENVAEGCGSFCTFLYDSEKGTVLGRGGASWARISVFYLFYYTFLASLFSLSIFLTWNILNQADQPYLQIRLQGPGLTAEPKLESKSSYSKDISFNMRNPNSYQKYVARLRSYLKKYNSDNQTGDDWVQCGGKTMFNEDGKLCKQDLADLGTCGDVNSNFGYDIGQPCILLRVNRIIGWQPVPYVLDGSALGFDDQDSRRSDSKAPSLDEVLSVDNTNYNPQTMYVSCYGKKKGDKPLLNNGVETAVSDKVKYFPRGFPFYNYPYMGVKLQKGYLSPLVAVQFTDVQKNKLIRVNCKVYSPNIIDDQRTEQGYIEFKLQVNDKQ